jgi:hypothetical protein
MRTYELKTALALRKEDAPWVPSLLPNRVGATRRVALGHSSLLVACDDVTEAAMGTKLLSSLAESMGEFNRS